MSYRLGSFFVAGAFALGGWACGSASDTGLFGPVPGGPGVDSGSTSDSGTHPDAGNVVDSGDHDAGTPAKDSGGPPPVDSGPPPPVDSGNPDKGIKCGDTGNAQHCTAPDICCRTTVVTSTFACEPEAQCNGLVMPCANAQDCANAGMPGTLCCIQTDTTGRPTSVSCVPTDQCGMNGSTNMCDPNAPNPCPNGGTCQPSATTIKGYNICK